MSSPARRRFWIGGAGALLPLLVTLVTLDLAAIIDDYERITFGMYVGACIRYFALFALGGFIAALNSDEDRPIKLVQLGIAAPAIVSSFVNAGSPGLGLQSAGNATVEIVALKPTDAAITLFSSAHASDGQIFDHRDQATIILAGGFLSDVIKGATRNLANVTRRREIEAQDAAEEKQRAIEQARQASEEAELRKEIRRLLEENERLRESVNRGLDE